MHEVTQAYSELDREGFEEEVFGYLYHSQFISNLASQANSKGYNLREHMTVYSVDKRWLREPDKNNSISELGSADFYPQ